MRPNDEHWNVRIGLMRLWIDRTERVLQAGIVPSLAQLTALAEQIKRLRKALDAAVPTTTERR